MKRLNLLSILALIVMLALASPVAAQRAGSGGGGVTTMAKTGQGCWVCAPLMGSRYCTGGVPGDWNCSYGADGNCMTSSPGCGAGAMLPLDPDGEAQYVSRGSAIGLTDVMAEGGGPPIRRNCEGVMVARYQAPANIANVRALTGSLSL